MAFNFARALAGQIEGKAIPTHPALQNSGVPVSVYSPGATRQDAKLSQREAPRHSQAYGGSEAIDWLYDAVNLYSDATAVAPWHLEKPDGTKLVKKRQEGTPDSHQVGPTELYDLLERPNPFMLYDELIDLLVIDLLLVGNAYWLKFRMTNDGKPLALYRLAPSHVKVIPGAFGPKRYEYQPPGAKDALKIDPAQIIHYKRANPHSAYYGLGVIQGGGRAFDLELAVTDTTANYYENKADPSMIVQSERRVPRDVFNKLRAQLRSRAGGSRNAGELLVLEAGLKASSLSASARDALFAEITKMSQDRVYSKFRASRLLFGYADAATADTVQAVRREFDNNALRPFMDRLQRRVTEGLCRPWDVEFKIDYRYQMAPEDIVKLGTDFAAVPGIKVKEVREFFGPLGFIPISTGDPEIDDEVLNMPMPELDANGQGGSPDRPLGSEPGRPPKGENTTNFPKSGTRKPTKTATRTPKPQGKALWDKADFILERAEGKALSEDARTTVGNRLPGEQRPQDPFSDARSADINAAMAYIQDGVADAAHTLERELLDTAEGKALPRSGNGKTNVVGRIRNNAAWKAFRERVQEVLTEGARRAAQAGVMHSGLEPDEELDYDAIAASVVNRPDGIRSIVRTLKERIVRHVKAERDKDEPNLTGTIQAEMKGWTQEWLPTVADSEATEAYNEGTLSAAEAAGVKTVYVHEEEDAPDEACQEASGQLWSIDEARERRKEHPRCRRAFLPIGEVA